MAALIGLLIKLTLVVLVLAILIGLLSGFSVVLWQWARGTLACTHDLVTSMGTRLASIAGRLVRDRFPNLHTGADASEEKARLHSEIHNLQYALADALGRAAGLSALVDDLRGQLHAFGDIGDRQLYRRVGLHPACPDFVLPVVRREFRRRLHPDAHAAARKVETTRRFQEAEEAFSKIWAARGLDQKRA